VLFVRMRM